MDDNVEKLETPDMVLRRARNLVDDFNKELTRFHEETGGYVAIQPVGNIGVKLVGITFLEPQPEGGSAAVAPKPTP